MYFVKTENKTVSVLWLAMIALTVLMTLYAEGDGRADALLTCSVLLAVALKAHWLIRYFMDLKGCALAWQLTLYTWLFVVLSGITFFTVGNW